MKQFVLDWNTACRVAILLETVLNRSKDVGTVIGTFMVADNVTYTEATKQAVLNYMKEFGDAPLSLQQPDTAPPAF